MTTPLRVASFNIRTSRGPDGLNAWRFRRRRALAAIRRLNADVTGLQEVRPDQLGFLRQALPDSSLIGEGRDADGGGENALVVVRPPWRVDGADTRWLSAEPDRPGSKGWDAGLPRVATITELSHGAARVVVANTHLDHQGVQARVEGMRLIVEWLSGYDAPGVVLGDLNEVPGSAVTQVLVDAGYLDALPADAGGTEHSFTGARDRKRIDHIFVAPSIRVRRGWVDYGPGRPVPRWRLPSDHWPVAADLELP